MDLIIRRDGELSEAERALIAAWQQDAYGDQTWTAEYAWTPPEWRLLLVDDGVPVSHLKLVTRDATAGGRPARIGGIGSVMTPSELRGRGYASELVRRAPAVLFGELGVEMGMLFCLSHLLPFYGALGWMEVRAPVWIHHPQRGRIPWPHAAMIIPPPGERWEEGEIDVCGPPW